MYTTSLLACLALLFGGTTLAAPPPTKAPTKAIVLQIDGLSPDLLRAYLGRPNSRGPKRFLHHLLGASPPGGGQIVFSRAHSAPTLAPIPTEGDTTARWLLADGAKGGHLGWMRPLSGGLLAQLITAKRTALILGVGAHHPTSPTVTVPRGKTPTEGLGAIRKRLSAGPVDFIYVREPRVAKALAEQGLTQVFDVLGAVDADLQRTFGTPSPKTTYFLTSGHGFAPLNTPTARPVEPFAKLIGHIDSDLQAFGGTLLVEKAGQKEAQLLADLSFVEAVYGLSEASVKRFDHFLKRFVPIEKSLEARLSPLLQPGQLLAVANYAESYYFSDGDDPPPKLMWGGLDEANARVPLLVVGPGFGPNRGPRIDTIAAVQEYLAALLGKGVPVARSKPCPIACQRRRAASGDVIGLIAAWSAHPAAARWLSEALGGASASAKDLSRGEIELAALALGRPVLSGDLAIAAGGFIHDLGGPAILESPAAQRQALHQLVIGSRALRGGHFVRALQALEGADGLPNELAMWRDLLRAWATMKAPGDWPETEFPLEAADPWIAGLSNLVKSWDESEEWAKKELLKKLPPITKTNGRRARLLKAFTAVYAAPPARFCVPSDRLARLEALESAADAFESLGLPGLAAIAVSRLSGYHLQDAKRFRADFQRSLRLLEAPQSAWTRIAEADGWLLRISLQPGQPLLGALSAEADAAAEMVLLETQARLLADDGPGATSRRAAYLGALTTGFTTRLPGLLDETLALGVRGTDSVAATLMQSLIAGGGITALLSPQRDQQLKAMLRLARGAVKALKARNAGRKGRRKLSDDERLARMTVPLIEAMIAGFSGDMTAGTAKIAEADDLLSNAQARAARRKAVKGLAEDAPLPPAALAPYVKMTLSGARALIEGFSGDLKAARKRVRGIIALAEGVALDSLKESGQSRALKGHVKALNGALLAAADLSFAYLDGAPKTIAKARKAARRAVSKLRLDLPEGVGRETGRWLVLTAVVIIDVVYVGDALGEQSPDAAQLTKARAALTAITADWGASKFGYAALTILRSFQLAVPELPALLKGSEDLGGLLGSLTRIESAIGEMARLLRADFSEAELMAALVKDDRVDLMFLDQIMTVLDAGLSAFSDQKALTALLDARLAAQSEALSGKTGSDALALGIFERMILMRFSDPKPTNGRALLARGRAASPGTAFEAHRYLWDLLEWRLDREAHENGASALLKARQHCPALGWQLLPGEAMVRAEAGDLPGAIKLLRQARGEAALALSGPLTSSFKMDIRDGHLAVNANITVPMMAAIFGRFSGTFQVGAGGASAEAKGRIVKWTLAGDGTPIDFALDTLLLEAFFAMLADDETTVDIALAQILALYQGIDPIFLSDRHPATTADRPRPSPRVRDPLAMLWVLTLAEARGHTRLAGALLNPLLQQGAGGWPDGVVGERQVCEDDFEPPADDHPMLTKARCNAPLSLYGMVDEATGKAVVAYTFQRLKARLSGRPEDAAALGDSLARISKLNPKLMPPWTADFRLGSSRKDALGRLPKGPQSIARIQAGDTELFERAGKNGYPCESSLSGAPARTALAFNGACGYAVFRFSGLLEAAKAEQGEAAWKLLLQASDIGWALQNLRHNTMPAVWAAMRALVIVDAMPWRISAAQRAVEAAKRAQRFGAPDQARYFQAAAFALSTLNGKPVKLPPPDGKVVDRAGMLLHSARNETDPEQLKRLAKAFLGED